MDENTAKAESIELLQQLGLKEYEAKCFVALTRLPEGTAKGISEVSEVPRTRVYDAVEVLESKGLVEIQHSNPQRFRAVPIEEAIETVRTEYETRMDRLQSALRTVEPASVDDEPEATYEVWSINGGASIDARTEQLVEDAEKEIILVAGTDGMLTDDLIERLQDAPERGVELLVGATSEGLRSHVSQFLPESAVFASDLEWLKADDSAGETPDIDRILMVDRNTLLVSTRRNDHSTGEPVKQAVIGRGVDNGVVTVVRRMLSSSLFSTDDPEQA